MQLPRVFRTRKREITNIVLSSVSYNANPNDPDSIVLEALARVVYDRGPADLVLSVRRSLSRRQVQGMYDLLNPGSRRQRPKYCEHGHRLISENVIHWPNGSEDCRTCYLEWKAKRNADEQEGASPTAAQVSKPAPRHRHRADGGKR